LPDIKPHEKIPMNYQLLLSPLKIDNLMLANRIVMPPLTTFLALDDGLVTQAHLAHYERFSGPGLVIVEGTAVLPEGRMSRRQLGIYSDRQIEGLARIARIIHRDGSIAALQIHHAGAVAFAETREEKIRHLAAILFRLGKQQLMVTGLHRIREAFRNAARRAVEAGFDIIELHGAHGFIFSQFLSPLKNWRLDRYGGSLENRLRFLLEIYWAAEEEVRGKALVTCRLGVIERNKKGLSLSEGLSAATRLEKEGMKLLDVSHGSGIPGHVQPEESRYSGSVHLAHAAKQVLQIPVIGGGGIRHPNLAEQALQDGMADLVFIGRGLLADPAWARKTIEGKSESISLCRECSGCFHYTDASKCPARGKT
jgi:NADPH2 dehydrogenase